ncbi:MAG: hypothetical protein GY787_13905 [Alteromonadales bacterium]|nr:hypothetical protein [Alteromonadales bacterium]
MLKLIKLLLISTLLVSYPLLIQAENYTAKSLIEQFSLPAFQKTVFVDQTINDTCQTYSPAKRNCKNGKYLAFSSITQATQHAIEGNLYLIRAGDYKEVLHLRHSGKADAYIGFVAYADEIVTLKDINSKENGDIYGPIWIDQASYNLVSGINVTGSVGFGRLLNSHHNIINNAQFIESTFWKGGRGKSKRGGLYIAFSHFNKITNSYFYKGTDSLSLVHSNHNLVENNLMDLAGHDIWNIKCGSFNVIRNNEFSNKNQKLGAVVDCEAGTMSWHGNGEFSQEKAVLDATKNNLIEHNTFRDASHYYSTSGGNGIQYAGQNGIIRFNLFYRTNAGLSLTSYKTEAMYNYDNRIYHNTFHDNWCVGITVSSEVKKQRDNEFVNNILWNNQGLSSSQCGDRSAKQILFRKTTGNNWFFNNNIGSEKSDKVIGVWAKEKLYSIYDYEGSYLPVQFDQNIAANPLFMDEKTDNYQLQKNSAMIDSGAFLSEVESHSGSGFRLKVKDASYFYDGFSIQGEQGDLIQIKGAKQTARIINVHYQSNELTLDRSLTWFEGDLITLIYKGDAPDIGAFEYSNN